MEKNLLEIEAVCLVDSMHKNPDHKAKTFFFLFKVLIFLNAISVVNSEFSVETNANKMMTKSDKAYSNTRQSFSRFSLAKSLKI